jgi:hypothetical protein
MYANAIPDCDLGNSKEMAPTEQSAWGQGADDARSRGARKKSKVLMGRSVCLQFMGDLLSSNDSDLMRSSRHSVDRERRGLRLFLDNARSHD